jgi:DNA-directed RNA polymerase specialized sigma subunit
MHGGDLDDLMSEANYAFLIACEKYDAERAAFNMYLILRIRWALWKRQEKLARQKKHEVPLSCIEEVIEDSKGNFLQQMREALPSDELITVLQSILYAPIDILMVMKGKQKKGKQQVMRDHLQSLGQWTSEQIDKTFEAIETTL